MDFNGKLTKEELQSLREQLVSEKKIRRIEYYLGKYKDTLTSYQDIAGNHDINDGIEEEFVVNAPGPMFFYNMKHFGYLLEEDAELEYRGIYKPLKKIAPVIIKKIGQKFMLSNQVYENRNFLRSKNAVSPSECKEDKGIILPDKPVLWTMNHHFKDDVISSARTCYQYDRKMCMIFASLPQFYNTFDGILAYLVGPILVNRKSSLSKKSSNKKLVDSINAGYDILIAPEGVWAKSPNELLKDLWPGVYRTACETGSPVVPVIHYIYDQTQSSDKSTNLIHTVVDDPIDIANITGMGEQAILKYYQEVMATWYYLMMEKYGHSTHEEQTRGYVNSKVAWDELLRKQNESCDYLDHDMERTAHYKPKGKVTIEDVYGNIANLPITEQNKDTVVDSLKLVREYKENDFQRRF